MRLIDRGRKFSWLKLWLRRLATAISRRSTLTPLQRDAAATSISRDAVEVSDDLPSLFWRFGVLKQLHVLVLDHALVSKELEINNAVPILFAVQNDRHVFACVRSASASRQ